MSLLDDVLKYAEHGRKAMGAAADFLVLTELATKDATGKVMVNARALPSFARDNEHTAAFDAAIAKLDPGEKRALLLHWIPTLDPIQNDDLVVTIATVIVSKNEAEAISLLKTIAAVQDPDPAAGGTSADALSRINAARTKIADSLNLIMTPVDRYPQHKLEQLKNGAFRDLADLHDFVRGNFPVVKKAIGDRHKAINDALNGPVKTQATSLLARAQAWSDKANK